MVLLLPVPWIELPFETLASAHMYDCFAKYLLLYYIIETGVNVGQTLSGDVATNHICTLINMAKRLIVGHTAHAGLGEAQWFFTCLDGGTSVHAKWLQKLKRRIDADSHVYETRKGEDHIMHTNTSWRMFCYFTVWMQVLTLPACVINVLTISHSITPAQTLAGEAREKGAKAIYTPIIADVTRQYARHGSADSVCRIFAILTLQRLMGRPAETKCLCVDAMRWDVLHTSPFIISPQTKTDKPKMAVFVAGFNRWLCWLVALGDMLVCTPNRKVYNPDKATWLLENLQIARPADTLSRYFKDVLPEERGGSSNFRDFTVPSLPNPVSSSGVRVAGINECGAKMPIFFVAQCSGHQLQNSEGAVYDYLDCSPPKCIPAAVVLAGWEAPPWGHIGVAVRHNQQDTSALWPSYIYIDCHVVWLSFTYAFDAGPEIR